jgi:hypothetical protein
VGRRRGGSKVCKELAIGGQFVPHWMHQILPVTAHF